ncbi:hypothetical protein [Allochromatium palmeri]|uniref:Uncharacterized protein n=1 Tax=Allochromatium palmeri TaxID=231048 RepID=A0A6N8EG01_9GAMM|nr:hypothetical protein [Allochromatium palmeri]MTW23165.1 hypothetical protein [Allochromatium palmeri]
MKKILLILSNILIFNSAFAVQVLDQSYDIQGGASLPEVRISNTLAQTFTVGITGYLGSVKLWNTRITSPTESLVVEIRSTNNGLPTEEILASRNLTPSEVGTSSSNLTNVDFSSDSVLVKNGDLLAIVLSSESVFPVYYSWAGNTDNPYTRGEGLVSHDDGISWNQYDARGMDFHFWTYVNPVSQAKPQISVKGGYVKVDVTNGYEPAIEDCTDTSHEGRMVIDNTNAIGNAEQFRFGEGV